MANKTITCLVSKDLYDKLEWYLDIQGSSIATFLRDYLDSFVDELEHKNPDIWEDMRKDRAFHEMMKKKYLSE